MTSHRQLRFLLALLGLVAFELGSIRAAYAAACLKTVSSASPVRSASSDPGADAAPTVEPATGPSDQSREHTTATQLPAGSCPGAPLLPHDRVSSDNRGLIMSKGAPPAADQRAGPEVALAPPFHPPRTI